MPAVLMERRRPGAETLSPSEAAFLADVSRKSVEQAIDRGEVAPVPARRTADRQRALEVSAAVYLRLRGAIGYLLSSEGKRRMYQSLSGLTLEEVPTEIDIGPVAIKTGPEIMKVQECLARLHRARELVVSDPEIRGGEPVVLGTRIPAHAIAEMVAQGAEHEAILAAYPALTPESLEAAVLYSHLHPRRGRPRSTPWQAKPPVRVFTPEELGGRDVTTTDRPVVRSHAWLDERSRALNMRVAEKLRENPHLVSTALDNIDRWEKQSGPDRAWTEWREILTTCSVSEIVTLLGEKSENANRLRQSSPFAGVLTEEERLAILREYAAV